VIGHALRCYEIVELLSGGEWALSTRPRTSSPTDQ